MPVMADIRKATKHDLATVRAWLRAESQETGQGFFCNWSIIERSFQREYLTVIADRGEVVGFLADGTNGPSILEVRSDARSKGYGRQLANRAIQAAFARGISVIEISCEPVTSVPFWESMGFEASQTLIGSDGGLYAHKVLQRRFTLADGPRATFEISFYPEARGCNPDTPPFRTYADEGLLLEYGSLQLPERAICFMVGIPN